MEINKKVTMKDIACIVVLIAVIVGTFNPNLQDNKRNSAYGQAENEQELVYGIAENGGIAYVLVFNATSNTFIHTHSIGTASSPRYGELGYQNIYWAFIDTGSSFNVARVKGGSVLSNWAFPDMCNGDSGAVRITGVASFSMVCEQNGNQSNIQFLTISNGEITANSTELNWNLQSTNDPDPYYVNDRYVRAQRLFERGTNATVFNFTSVGGISHGFLYNNAGYMFEQGAGVKPVYRIVGNSPTAFSVAPQSAANGVIRDNLLIVFTDSATKVITMNPTTGSIIQNITLTSGANSYGTANRLSDGSFTRLYKQVGATDELKVYDNTGTFITSDTNGIDTLHYLAYAGVFTYTEPSGGGTGFCDLPENENILICRLGGDGTLGSGGAFIIGNTTQGTGILGTACTIGIVDCITNPDPKTNGLGLLIFIASIFVIVGMFFRSLGAENTFQMPVFIWIVIIIALSAFFTLTNLIDPIFLILSIISIVALAVPKIVNTVRGSTFGSGSTE